MAIDSIIANASARVAGAIREAARSTGASFEYLLTAARIESNLNPSAQATTSSATGLYQFIDQTWLATLKQAGPSHGYGLYADAITLNADGRYEVPDPNMRAAIMKLRNDPAAAATMAGAFTQNNATRLSASIGRRPSEGELYIAHFLGSDGAARLINAAANQPQGNAAEMFPAAAQANHSIFMNKSGKARTIGEVYATLAGRFDIARALSTAPSLRGSVPAEIAPSDPAGVTQVFAQASPPSLPAAVVPVPIPATPPEQRPFFQSMFTGRGGRQVAQTVSNLWTPGADAPAAGVTRSLFTDAPAPKKPGKT
jgi:hypothetical protein